MSLLDQDFLILDCQTTGIRPSVGHLLEISWVWASATDHPGQIRPYSQLVTLPDGAILPSRVREITGITEADLIESVPIELVRSTLLEDLKAHTTTLPPTVLIHYAQFEKPFLWDLLQLSPADSSSLFEIVCTHRLAKRLYPHIPSRNIRGLSGFFGTYFDQIKRASQHVQATFEIWKGLAQELDRLGVKTAADLNPWLETAPRPKANAIRYEYHIEKQRRLSLPSQPGIYRMYSKTGKVLYVGKATSLKERVNSYFRGKRGRDPRRLELMAQVWDLDVTPCKSALEAALLETDEIKKHDPPYNVSLKARERNLVFYSRDFSSTSGHQDAMHPLGPFRPFNSIERLLLLTRSSLPGAFPQVFHDPLPPDLLEAGYKLFCGNVEIDVSSAASKSLSASSSMPSSISIRDHLAIGMRLKRKLKASPETETTTETMPQPDDSSDINEFQSEFQSVALQDEEPLTPEEVAEKFERLYLRAADELHRSYLLTRLLDSNVRWSVENEWRSLRFRHGQVENENCLHSEKSMNNREVFPWNGLGIAAYDRMSILLAELAKAPHEIFRARYETGASSGASSTGLTSEPITETQAPVPEPHNVEPSRSDQRDSPA